MELLRKYIGEIGQDLVLDDFNLKEAQIRISQSAAESAAERHESIDSLNKGIAEQDVIIEYLEKVEKILGNMHWEIKNIIDINKMEQL